MNLSITRILVPVDFSPHSERALHYATALAARLGASVDLLHVVEDPFASGASSSEVAILDPPEVREALIAEGERRLQEPRFVAARAGIPVVTTVRMGPAAQVIVDHADTAHADLIVMGTHGRTGLKHMFMGSVAERVVRHAPCPVVTLREAAVREDTSAAVAVGTFHR